MNENVKEIGNWDCARKSIIVLAFSKQKIVAPALG